MSILVIQSLVYIVIASLGDIFSVGIAELLGNKIQMGFVEL